jgi:hypothetical protein
MKTLRFIFCLAFGAWLAGDLFQAHAQPAAVDGRVLRQQELQARGGVDSALTALRRAEAAKAANIGELRQSLAAAESAYRRAVSARVVGEAAVTGQKPDLAALQRDIAQREASARTTVADYLHNRLQDVSDADKPVVMAGAESMLRALRLESEIVNEAARRANPAANPTTKRMDELLARISTTDTNEERANRSAVDHETEMWLRDRQRRQDIEEYQRLARNGQFLGTNGQPITGTQRERVALDAEKQLAESLEYHAREKTKVIDWWFNSSDSRHDLAKQIQSDIDSAPEYQALKYLSPAENSVQQNYRALALAVRNSQSQMDEWYTKEYLGQSDADTKRGNVGAHAHAWWSTGFGTLARANDLTGESSNAHVQAKMDAMRRDTDAAAEAFMAAANTPDPSRLPQHQRELLQSYGYINEGADKKLSYTIPQGRQQLGSLTQADMPGASVLDAINMETVAVTAASVALPELAAARVGALATKFGAGTQLATRLGQAASMATGVAVDAGTQYLTTGKVDAQKLVVDNLLVGSIAGKIGDLASTGTSKLAGLLRAEGKAGPLAKSMEKAIAETLGLTTENVLQTAYQNTVAAGRPDLQYEDFLASMMTGAMGRGMASTHMGQALDKQLVKPFDAMVAKLPEGRLKEVLARDPAVILEERHRAEAFAEHEKGTMDRYKKITENVTDPLKLPAVVGEAVMRGEFSWNDLKTLSASGDPNMTKIHDAVVTARADMVKFLDKAARENAHEGLRNEYDQKVADLKKRGLPKEQFDVEEAALKKWRDGEAERIDKPAVILGSDGRGSDIDRSWASDRVRDEARRLQDRIFAGDEGLPTTSGRAMDLNEYYDVMPFLRDMYKNGTAHLSELPGVRVDSKKANLTHGEAMSASGLAAAMMHMDADQRAIFEKNKLTAAPPDKRASMEAQFAWAKENLSKEKQLVAERAQKIAAEANAKIQDPANRVRADDADVQLRARDQIYGERMKELIKLEQQIKGLPDQNGPEANRLKAEYERKMSVALREGIEAYSQSAGLDAIVNEWQGTKTKDPVTGEMRKRTFKELMASADFAPGGEVAKKYTPAQLDGMLNDQVMFMMEHMNGYRHGHESPEAAARAIGKYGERALLALKMQGKDINSLPQDHPLRKFMSTAEAFTAVKDKPEELKKLLSGMSADGDAGKGIRKVFEQLEALPGMEGISKSFEKLDPDSMRIANQAARRRWEQEKERARLSGGPTAEMEVIKQQEAEVDGQIAAIKDATAQQKDLDGRYLRADQTEAKRLEGELAGLKERRANLPGGKSSRTPTAQALDVEIDEREKKLEALKGKYADAGSPKDQGAVDLSKLNMPPLVELERRKKELEDQRGICGTGMLAAEEERKKKEKEDALKAAGISFDPKTGEPIFEKPLTDENGKPLATAPSGTPASPPPNAPPPAPGAEPALPTPGNTGTATTAGVDSAQPLPPRPSTLQPKPDVTDWGGEQSSSGGGLKLTIPQSRFRIGNTITVQFDAPKEEKWQPPVLHLRDENDNTLERFTCGRGKGAVSFKGPLLAGNYQIRAINDKDETVCTLGVPVVVTPTPGALRIGTGDFLIGSKVQVTVSAPQGTWSNSPWVGMYVTNRQDGREPLRVSYERAPSLNCVVNFTLPAYSADIEFRLYDRDENYYQLDAIGLRTKTAPAPGSLRLSNTTFAIGDPVNVSLSIAEGVYAHMGNAWIGLYDLTRRPENGTGITQPPRLHYEWVQKRTGVFTFQPPPLVGEYELRLYDRDQSALLLDAVRFSTFSRSASGTMKVTSPTVNIGQPISVQLAVPDNVYLGAYAHVALHQLDGGAARGALAPSLGRVDLPDQKTKGRNATLTFTAPDYPCSLQLRLFDRDKDGILLATAPVQVVTKAAPGALKLPKTQFAPGETVKIGVTMPPDVKLFSWSHVTLHALPSIGKDFRAKDAAPLQTCDVDTKTMSATLITPDLPGRYEFRLYDRTDWAFQQLDRVVVEVVQPPAKGSLRSPGSGQGGSKVQVGFNIPQGVYLGGWPYVELVEPRAPVPGGALRDASRLTHADLPQKARSGSVELTLPRKGGQYQLRLFDRGSDGILLDTAPLTVTPPPKP